MSLRARTGRPFRGILLFLLLIPILFVLLSSSPRTEVDPVAKIRQRGVLLWGGDVEGGAPYVFPDPKDTDRLVGFEVELAEAIGRELGVRAKFVQNQWDSLMPDLPGRSSGGR